MNDIKLGIAGFGNMGSAIYHSVKTECQVSIFDPYINQDSDLPLKNNIEDFCDTSNLLLLSMKPDQVAGFLSQVKKPARIVSIAAGLDIQTIESLSPSGSKILRLMPNLPLTVGEGSIGAYGDESLFAIIQSLFSKMGTIVKLKNEKLMDAVTGLSGSGPAFVFEFIHALAEGGVLSGLSYADAISLAIQTVKGSAIYLEKMNLHPSELRNKVTSPGGTTITGLYELERNGFHACVMDAVRMAAKRSEELGKKKE